jgi:hypothetical protein
MWAVYTALWLDFGHLLEVEVDKHTEDVLCEALDLEDEEEPAWNKKVSGIIVLLEACSAGHCYGI